VCFVLQERRWLEAAVLEAKDALLYLKLQLARAQDIFTPRGLKLLDFVLSRADEACGRKNDA